MRMCRVTGFVLSPDGGALSGGRVEFTMSNRDRDHDVTVIPYPVSAYIAGDGSVDVELWPNSVGYSGTIYFAKVIGLRGKIYATFTVVVPDAPTAILADISDSVPPPSVDDARQQVILAREVLAETRAARDETLPAAAQVADDKVYVQGAVKHIDEIGGQIAGDREHVRQAVVHIDEVGGQVAGDREHVRQAVAHIDEVGGHVAGDREHVRQAAVHIDEVGGQVAGDREHVRQAVVHIDEVGGQVAGDAEDVRQAVVHIDEVRDQIAGDAEHVQQAVAHIDEVRDQIAGDAEHVQRAVAHIDEVAGQVAGNLDQTGKDAEATKKDAASAKTDATAAAAASNIEFGVRVVNLTGIENGEYYAQRRANAKTKIMSFYAEVISGNANSEVAISIIVNGATAYGPIIAKAGTPANASDLNVAVPLNASVHFGIVVVPGAIREVITQTFGKIVA